MLSPLQEIVAKIQAEARKESRERLPGTLLEIKWLIMRLLNYRILCRGAVTLGKLIHKNEYIFGPALVEAYRSINLDDYQGREFELWSSTPAVVWTADRPQEKGIHVHIYEGTIEGRKRIVDDTFGQVIYKGSALNRRELWEQMTSNTLY